MLRVLFVFPERANAPCSWLVLAGETWLRASCRSTAATLPTPSQQAGPIVAPFLGAALAQAFGWRSTMWFLAIMAGLAEVAVLVIYR